MELMAEHGRATTGARPIPTERPSRQRAPGVATYRLQLHAAFVSPTLPPSPTTWRPGVSHVYLSPVLQAAKGSTHGYDVVDPGG